nr:hypothetical protein [Tanacetum cinerariifolium]
MIDNHSIDRLVKDVLMMELVMHTEKNDTVFHTEKTGMLMLVVEIDVGGMTADVVDKLTCSSDDVQPSQLEWLLLLIIQSISVTGSLHSLQLLARGVDHSQQILESSVHVVEFFVPDEISPPKDAETPVESSIPVSPSSSVGSSSPV